VEKKYGEKNYGKKKYEKKYEKKSTGKKVREKGTGKKYVKKITGKKYGKEIDGKKVRGKSHVTSGQGLFRSLLVKHAQWSDPLDPPQIISENRLYTTHYGPRSGFPYYKLTTPTESVPLYPPPGDAVNSSVGLNHGSLHQYTCNI
jgi:hypothetical protein